MRLGGRQENTMGDKQPTIPSSTVITCSHFSTSSSFLSLSVALPVFRLPRFKPQSHLIAPFSSSPSKVRHSPVHSPLPTHTHPRVIPGHHFCSGPCFLPPGRASNCLLTPLSEAFPLKTLPLNHLHFHHPQGQSTPLFSYSEIFQVSP